MASLIQSLLEFSMDLLEHIKQYNEPRYYSGNVQQNNFYMMVFINTVRLQYRRPFLKNFIMKTYLDNFDSCYLYMVRRYHPT